MISYYLIIFKGTKYCVVGEDEDMDDLGRYENTDFCCRQHDQCPISIKKFGWRYGIMNWRPYTVTSCQCNEQFFACLQEVHSPVSAFVEKMFFDILKVPCITREESEYKVKNSLFG